MIDPGSKNDSAHGYPATMEKLHELLMRFELAASVLLLVVLLAVMGSQVIARYLFRAPFSWSEEVARFAMIWMAFLAAARVMGGNGHIAVDLWSGKTSSRAGRNLRWVQECCVNAIVVASCLILVAGSWRFVWHVRLVGSPSLSIPKSLWYGSVSLGFLLMANHAWIRLIALLRRRAASESQLDQELGP